MSILNRAFFYFFFNMLLVPGLSIPSGSNLFKMLTKIFSLKEILQNFYNIQQGDFFIILLMQQVSFGFFTNLTQIGMLSSYCFSPIIFLRIHNKDPKEQIYFKYESSTNEYGYNYALSLTILAIIMIFWLINKHPYSFCSHFGNNLPFFEVYR